MGSAGRRLFILHASQALPKDLHRVCLLDNLVPTSRGRHTPNARKVHAYPRKEVKANPASAPVPMINSLDCKEVFTDIYARKVWGDGSGGGSGEQAKPYCKFVEGYVLMSRIIKTDGQLIVLDIGCGDLAIAKGIEWGDALYIGVDSADQSWPAVDLGQRCIMRNFDALTKPLPEADLILCKEVLQHLSNEQVQTLLDRTAHYPRRLFTNSTFLNGKEVNEDITTGDFRAVDLTLPPFNQPAKTVFTYGNWIVQELTKP